MQTTEGTITKQTMEQIENSSDSDYVLSDSDTITDVLYDDSTYTIFSILEENFSEYPFLWNCVFPQDTICALAKYRPDFTFDR